MPTLLWLVTALGCASPPPYACTTPVDPTGRGLPLCHDPNRTPACDAPGDVARYEMNGAGVYVLVGGTVAQCDTSNQVVCPDRAVLAHCIADPVAP